MGDKLSKSVGIRSMLLRWWLMAHYPGWKAQHRRLKVDVGYHHQKQPRVFSLANRRNTTRKQTGRGTTPTNEKGSVVFQLRITILLLLVVLLVLVGGRRSEVGKARVISCSLNCCFPYCQKPRQIVRSLRFPCGASRTRPNMTL